MRVLWEARRGDNIQKFRGRRYRVGQVKVSGGGRATGLVVLLTIWIPVRLAINSVPEV